MITIEKKPAPTLEAHPEVLADVPSPLFAEDTP
jgi:hypothetical protein